MTDPIKRINLLEGPAFPREVAIQDADAAIADLDADLPRRVAGPDIAAVPAAYLPARAWGRSVDVYDPAWPEAVRRDVIVVSPEVHEFKGAVHAVELALGALLLDAKVTEWWQTTPRGVPYTFKVTAFARARIYDGEVILDPRLIKVTFATVMRTKPLSRAFAFAVGATFPRPLGLGSVAAGKVTVRRAAHPSLDIATGSTLGLAPVAIGRVVVRKAVLLRNP